MKNFENINSDNQTDSAIDTVEENMIESESSNDNFEKIGESDVIIEKETLLESLKTKLNEVLKFSESDRHPGDSKLIENLKNEISALEGELNILEYKNKLKNKGVDFGGLRNAIQENEVLKEYYEEVKYKFYSENENGYITRKELVSNMIDYFTSETANYKKHNALRILLTEIIKNEKIEFGKGIEPYKIYFSGVSINRLRHEISESEELKKVYEEAKNQCLNEGNYTEYNGHRAVKRPDILKKMSEILNKDRNFIKNIILMREFRMLIENCREYNN